MQLNVYETYVYGNYTYKNFVNLSEDELLTILEWRNHPNIRKCMNNTAVIAVETHLNFVRGLHTRNDVSYWQVSVGKRPVGVLNIIDIDMLSRTCEPGFYLAPEAMGKGEGLFFLYNYKSFLLNELGFDKLIGHNYLDNMPALQFTLFFGAQIVDILEIDGRKSIRTILERSSFNEIDSHRLLSQYVGFIRRWDIDSILK